MGTEDRAPIMADDENSRENPNRPNLKQMLGIDPAVIVAEVSIQNTTPGINGKEIWEIVCKSPLFEEKGEPVIEEDGSCFLIQDCSLMGYPVSIWINYKPYFTSVAMLDAPKAAFDHHTKTCFRDGWGKIYVLLADDLNNNMDMYDETRSSTALTIMEGMKHQAFKGFDDLIEFGDFEGF